jgi:hypothetical protein
MKIIIKIAKFAYRVSNSVVNLLGLAFLSILLAYSVDIIYGYPSESQKWDLSSLLKPSLVWYWVGIWVVFVVGFFINVIHSIVRFISRGVKSVRDKKSGVLPNQPQKNMWVEALKWFLTN